MRARYLIRDMANGDAAAWTRADMKLSQSDIQASNRRDLTDAMATLPDPRRPEPIEREPVDHRRYAVEVYAAADWGDGPALDTDFVFERRTDAVAEAFRQMWRQYCLSSPRDEIGAYVISDDAETTESGDPSVEILLTLPNTTLRKGLPND
jgi:hypothetical protein